MRLASLDFETSLEHEGPPKQPSMLNYRSHFLCRCMTTYSKEIPCRPCSTGKTHLKHTLFTPLSPIRLHSGGSVCSGLWNGLTSQLGACRLVRARHSQGFDTTNQAPRGLKAESKAAHTSLDVQKERGRDSVVVHQRDPCGLSSTTQRPPLDMIIPCRSLPIRPSSGFCALSSSFSECISCRVD